jgi:aminoglycoside/choline kinase family phosphotransferase
LEFNTGYAMKTQSIKNDLITLHSWCEEILGSPVSYIKNIAGDASFRRYYRVLHDQHSYVVMLAPGCENLPCFIKIAAQLDTLGLMVPKIHAKNEEQGLLLLSDLGDELYLNHLNNDTADHLYQQAMNALLQLQSSPNTLEALPIFNEDFIVQQLHNTFRVWYLETHLQLKLSPGTLEMLSKTFQWIAQEIQAQPYTLTHMDYHSRNLMVLDTGQPGILDFQDAMLGPITYDLSSLLKDSYIHWARPRVLQWLEYYYQQAQLKGLLPTQSFSQFLHSFEITGLQRHLKNLGIFARLNYRDNKPQYLQHVPLLLQYSSDVLLNYPPLQPLQDFLQNQGQTIAAYL